MTGQKLLLVSPSFHGYWRSIEDAFSQLGHDTATHCYDAASKAEKAYNKLRYELPSLVTGTKQHLSPELVTRRAIAAVRERRPDIVITIRGDVLTDDYWDAVERFAGRHVLWLYDEVRRMRHPLDRLRRLAPLVTYSHDDAAYLRGEGIEALHVLNAFDPGRLLPDAQPRPEITFVGARFAAREDAVFALQSHGLPVRAYGRDWSSHIVDRLRTWRWHTPPVPNARDISLEEAWGVMRDSLATLNVHGDQDGFTMRTFESCGVGAVQLIDRPDVADLFEPGREVLVFASEDELIEHARRAVRDTAGMAELRRRAMARARAEHTFVHRARRIETLWA